MSKVLLEYKYATCLDKVFVILGVICSAIIAICSSLVSLTFGTATGVILSYVNENREAANEEQREESVEKLKDGIVTFVIETCGLGITALVLTYLATILFNYSALRQIYRIRLLYLGKLLDQDIPWYDVNQTGDFASRMSTDIKKLEEGIGEKVSMFVFFEVQFVSSLILALIRGWELSLICLVSFPISTASMAFLTWISSKLTKEEIESYASAGTIAEEVLGAIRTVVAFGGENKERERYDKLLVVAKDNNIKRSLFTAISNALMWFFTYTSFALSFWYGAKLINKQRSLKKEDVTYDPGNIVAIFGCIMQGTMSFGMAAPYLETISAAKGAAGKIFDVIDSQPTINVSKGNGKKLSRVQGNLTFENVHFSYPSRPDVKVLQGFNLTIRAGETVALVGGSGCGKSTCVQLIQRFYDPNSGEVYLDSSNMKDLDLTWMRQLIGVVGQESVLFEGTIAQNIRFGNKMATQDDIETASKRANAHEFINSLPQGYLTRVGEGGTQLSGGQKQRIAIARALLRKPTILLLDEATSALDTNSEALVQAALDEASNECTTVIVAHRLSTVRKATRIIVMEDGQVQEEGSHDQLMLKKGIYYQLVTTQLPTEEAPPIFPSVSGRKSENDPRFVIPQVPTDKSISFFKSNAVAPADSETSTSASLRSIMKINRPETCHIVLGCLASIFTGTSIPLYAVIFGATIGVFASNDPTHLETQIGKYSLYFLALGAAIAVATIFQLHMFGIAGEMLSMRLRSRMFGAMLNQEMGWFDDKENGVGSLCLQLSGEAAVVQGATGSRLGAVLNALTTMCLALGVSFFFHWRLSFVALAFCPIIVGSFWLEQKIVLKESRGDYGALRKSSKVAVEAISNIRTIASLGCENLFYELYVEELSPYYELARRNSHLRGLVYAVSRNIMFFAYSATFYYGSLCILKGTLEPALFFTVIESLITGSWSIANASSFTPNLHKALISASRIFKLLHRVPRIRNAAESFTPKWKTSDISYEQIHFSYPTRPTIGVLKGLTLSILQGKKVALVGPSGCGKSTIVQLLERFYDPDHGRVTIDQQDIKTVHLERLRSHMGVVAQEPNLFSRTIAENIAYGDNTRAVTRDEVIDAAKKANIHNFITSLPLGYETKLGEKGTQLSGGQKQRVAIARALVRNPKVLLLDEATSALDSESEKVVQEALDFAKKGRTSITIAHRLTTVQDSDVICAINHGRVVEMGTHSELMGRGGLYYNLYRLQGGSS